MIRSGNRFCEYEIPISDTRRVIFGYWSIPPGYNYWVIIIKCVCVFEISLLNTRSTVHSEPFERLIYNIFFIRDYPLFTLVFNKRCSIVHIPLYQLCFTVIILFLPGDHHSYNFLSLLVKKLSWWGQILSYNTKGFLCRSSFNIIFSKLDF